VLLFFCWHSQQKRSPLVFFVEVCVAQSSVFCVVLWRSLLILLSFFFWLEGRPGHHHMVVGFTTTYAISAYYHCSCEFESRSWRGVLDTTLSDKVCQWLATGQWFSMGTSVSSTNKTDSHDITEILLKVASNNIILTLPLTIVLSVLLQCTTSE